MSIYYSIFGSSFFLFLSAFFSSSETALFSIPREKISFYRDSQNRVHRWIHELLINGQETLLIILLGNLFVNITFVTFSHSLMSILIKDNTPIKTMLGATFLLVVFGEITPKNIAIKYNEPLSVIVAPVIYYLKKLAYPVIKLLLLLNNSLLSRLSSLLRKPSPYITLKELKNGISEYQRRGIISTEEKKMILKIVDTGNLQLRRAIQHRTNIPNAGLDSSVESVRKLLVEKKQTYCIIHTPGNPDDILGTVYLCDILQNSGVEDISKFINKPLWVPETQELADALVQMVKDGYTTLCIIDEYGVFSGAATLSEICSEFLKIMDRGKKINYNYLIKSGTFRGTEEIANIKDWIPDSLLENRFKQRTLNGLLTSHLGKIPETGYKFAIDGWTFYIKEASGKRIKKVHIKRKD